MLARPQRLRNRRDFRQVYQRGRSFVNPTLVLYVRRSAGDGCRIGFSISKKVGGAVWRNRIKRRLGEACRARLADCRAGFDAILVARGPARGASFDDLQRAVDDLFGRARLLPDPSAPGGPACGAC